MRVRGSGFSLPDILRGGSGLAVQNVRRFRGLATFGKRVSRSDSASSLPARACELSRTRGAPHEAPKFIFRRLFLNFGARMQDAGGSAAQPGSVPLS